MFRAGSFGHAARDIDIVIVIVFFFRCLLSVTIERKQLSATF
jgi:hypothetical protein